MNIRQGFLATAGWFLLCAASGSMAAAVAQVLPA